MTTGTTYNKFQRTYQIQITDTNNQIQTFGSLTGNDPLLTLEFSIKRDTLQGLNTANIRIRNINASTRNVIVHDWYNNYNQWQKVTLRAGYAGTPLSTIFDGNAQSVYNYRAERDTDWTTEIDALGYSSLINNSFSAWTLGATNPVTQKEVVTQLVKDMQSCATKYGATLGVGCVAGFTAPRYTYTANDFTWNILRTETQSLTYIDNSSIYAMPNNYVFTGPITLISSKTGLLGTPRQYGTYLVAQMIFEPGIIPGQLVALDCGIPALNSTTYKVVGLQHAGVISSTVSGKCVTTVTMQLTASPYTTKLGLYQTT